MRNKLLLLLVGIFLFVACVAIFVSRAEAPKQNTVELPSKERVEAIGNGYLYATNRDLRDLLFDLDIHFKNQGLTSDRDSEAFEFPDESEGGKNLVSGPTSCVEFKYFSDENDPKVTFTLIPKDSACFTDEDQTVQYIDSLRSSYRFVFAAEIL